MTSGLYIALEGGEGCGKSTQAKRLAQTLDAVLTRESGGTPVGERLRAILHDVSVDNLDARSEALIFAADRAQHMQQVIAPALDAGRTVVSDRSVYTSLAYQGYGRGVDLDDLRRINDWAVRGRWPDLVILLDAPDEEIAVRLGRRELDRFERESADFHQRVIAGYRVMAADDPERWRTVDGAGSIDSVATTIFDIVAAARTDR